MKILILSLICLFSVTTFAEIDNTCDNDTATHKYADISGNSIKFSPIAERQVVTLSNGKRFMFTEKCTDYKDPNTPPTIIIIADGLGTINGTFIPITSETPLLHITGALNADLQQISVSCHWHSNLRSF